MHYTTKGLTTIEGVHDVFNCTDPDCVTCKAFWDYAAGLREQMKQSSPGELSVKQWIIARYQAGTSVREIAFNVNWSDTRVENYLIKCGVFRSTPRKRTSQPVKAKYKVTASKPKHTETANNQPESVEHPLSVKLPVKVSSECTEATRVRKRETATAKSTVPDPVQLALSLGTTKQAVKIKRTEQRMRTLIEAGLSRQAIAKQLHHTPEAVYQYIATHPLPRVHQQTVTLYDVTYSGGHRYFDRDGNEYQVKRMENE